MIQRYELHFYLPFAFHSNVCLEGMKIIDINVNVIDLFIMMREIFFSN